MRKLVSDVLPYLSRGSSYKELRRIMIVEANIFLSDKDIIAAYEAHARNIKWFTVDEYDKRGICVPVIPKVTSGYVPLYYDRLRKYIPTLLIRTLVEFSGYTDNIDELPYDIIFNRETLYICGEFSDELIDLGELMADWMCSASYDQIQYMVNCLEPSDYVAIFKMIDERWNKLVKLKDVQYLTGRIINEYQNKKIFKEQPEKHVIMPSTHIEEKKESIKLEPELVDSLNDLNEYYDYESTQQDEDVIGDTVTQSDSLFKIIWQYIIKLVKHLFGKKEN